MAKGTGPSRALEAWLDRQGWYLAPFQRALAEAFQAGEDGLCLASTGSGKTLAAFLGPALSAKTGEAGLQLLWVTPLRALASDLARQLEGFCDGLGLPWRVAVRNGDSSAAERRKLRTALPEVLIITPESLALLLADAAFLQRLSTLRGVVVDEWHELLGTKRGVLLELTLARLDSLAPRARRWGLSATVADPQHALEVLLGPERQGRCLPGPQRPPPRVRTLIPEEIERFPWAGHLGLRSLPGVLEAVHAAPSTLIFCNTRFQAERWFEALLRADLSLVGQVALHHGSLAQAQRRQVEAALGAGQLRAVVATASLDLGVDFAPVTQVIQIGGPKGVARLLQRAGRSGHHPGGESNLLCVPTHAFELLEFAALRRALAAGTLEPREGLRNCLDVLTQHVLTRILGEPGDAPTLLKEARRTYAFATLSANAFSWVLDHLQRGGPALKAYDAYAKIHEAEDGRLAITSPRTARRHRLSIGTIVSDATVALRWRRGGGLGQVEERFIRQLRPGDGFTFGGRKLVLCRVEGMTAFVRPGTGRRTFTPRWAGSRMPLSSTLAEAVLACLEDRAASPDCPEMQALAPLLALQDHLSSLPGPDRLLVERLESREGHHLFIYPFAGRRVHEGLGPLLAWRLGQAMESTLTTTVNDYGIELLSSAPLPEDEATLRACLSPEGLGEALLACCEGTGLAQQRFRTIARISGLIFQGFPGGPKSQRALQLSAQLLYDVLKRYDADNALVQQATREVLEEELEAERLTRRLRELSEQRWDLRQLASLSPFAFPLWAARVHTRYSTESAAARITRMLGQLERRHGAA
ncbi:MAG: ligase-associated DNA damage response DEXH box helicase [Proteobacteria bacterium]|nr:ligase-associated DNA damage response DEXH box helicase [Pseudomonadota bacterium]